MPTDSAPPDIALPDIAMLDVHALAVRGDGVLLASGGRDGAVRLWTLADARPFGRPMWGHVDAKSARPTRVDGLAFLGDVLVSAGLDRTVRVWDPRTCAELAVLRGHAGRVRGLAVDGEALIASACDGGELRVWEWRDGAARPVWDAKDARAVFGVAFSPDRSVLASIGPSGIRFWEPRSGRQVRPAIEPGFDDAGAHPGAAYSLAWSPEGKCLATASHGGGAMVWELASGRGTALAGGQTFVFDVAWGPDDRIYTAGGDGTVQRWERDGARGAELVGHRGPVFAVVPTRAQVITGGWDITIRLWETDTGRPTEVIGSDVIIAFSARYSPDGTQLATTYRDGLVEIRDAATLARIGEPFVGHANAVHAAVWSPDGRELATSGYDCTVRVWDGASGYGRVLGRHDDVAPCVAWSPRGDVIATSSRDQTIRLWDAVTGALRVPPLLGHREAVRSVAFSPDGAQVIAGSKDNTMTLWDVASGARIGEPWRGHAHWVLAVCWSAEGVIASAGQDNTVRLWAPPLGREVAALTGHDGPVFTVSFSRDGALLASGGYDGTVRIWSVAERKLMRTIVAHAERVHSVDFSPDGATLASAGKDGRILVWRLADGEQIGEVIRG